jgi:hypothetical protein
MKPKSKITATDSLDGFIKDCCDISELAQVPMVTFFNSYVKYCADRKYYPLSQNIVKKNLKEMGCEIAHSGRDDVKFFLGISVRENNDLVSKVDSDDAVEWPFLKNISDRKSRPGNHYDHCPFCGSANLNSFIGKILWVCNDCKKDFN